MNDHDEHYFTGSARAHGLRHAYSFTLIDNVYDIHTDAGIFSGDRLDKGTAVLLDTYRTGKMSLPERIEHDVLDLGCGAGPLALVLAQHYPENHVWAVDINEQAVRACQHNAALNGCSNVRARLPEDIPSDVQFSVIWSNPPIRIGKDQLHALMLLWLTRLTPDGVAFIVVNKNLGGDSLADWLTLQHFKVEKVASSKGFRVLKISPALSTT